MIRAIKLASGSKANSLLVEVDGCHILLDVGLSYKALTKMLSLNNTTPRRIHSIFVTHSHGDHIAGGKMILQRHGTTIYRPSEKTYVWDKQDYKTDKFVALPGGGYVMAVPAAHDMPCCSYIVSDKRGNKLSYITDTGTILCDSLPYFLGSNIIVIEMNHELSLLKASSYNDFLKKRVSETHLNNVQAIDFIELMLWDGLRHIVPWHLSKENNSEKFVLDRLKQLNLCDNVKVIFDTCTCL